MVCAGSIPNAATTIISIKVKKINVWVAQPVS
jgi:hypothetical protein